MNGTIERGRLRRLYRLLGLTVETDLVLQTPLPAGTGTPDLRIHLTQEGKAPDWPVPSEAVFQSPNFIESGLPFVCLHRGPQGDLLRFSEVAEFFLRDDEIHIHLLDADLAFMVEVHLLGTVMSYWLERRGIPVLHAAAVSIDGRSVAFLGTNRAGKSSLAVALMQNGSPLLSDDLVGLQASGAGIAARPGFPSMRMWPDLAEHVLGDRWEQQPLAHPRYLKRRINVGLDGFGRFSDEVQPLACLYFPRRRDDDDRSTRVEFEAVPAGEAVFELLRQSFIPWITQVDGFATHRLRTFSALVGAVPVRRLLYPGGFEHLHRVGERVLDDLPRAAHRRK